MAPPPRPRPIAPRGGRGTWVSILLLTLLLLPGCGQDGTEPRRIVVYSPHGDDILEDFKQRFEAANPGYRVVPLDMGSTEVLDRLRGEAERPRADVWWGAPASIFMLGARDGLLEPYQPTWSSAVPGQQRDPQHRWYATFKLPIVLGYHRELTREEELPESWTAVVDDRYAGRYVIRHPLASGTMTTLITSRIFQSLRDTGSPEAGYHWLSRLDACTDSYAPNPQVMYDTVARGGKWTLWGISDLVYQAHKAHDPLPFGYRVLEGETPVILDCIALVRGGPCPEGARRFYEFVTGPESLAHLARQHHKIPVRQDLPPDSLPAWMREIGETPMAVDREVLAAHTQEWMNHWDLQIQSRGQR
jgi:iron(III) transport system substrate-binding protein